VSYNQISWRKSPTAGVVGYKVFRNGKFVEDTTSLSFTDFSIQTGKTYVYQIVAYDQDLHESSPVSVTVRVP